MFYIEIDPGPERKMMIDTGEKNSGGIWGLDSIAASIVISFMNSWMMVTLQSILVRK